MLEIEKPRIECVEMSRDNRYGKFVIEPLERGFGHAGQLPAAHPAEQPARRRRHQHQAGRCAP